MIIPVRVTVFQIGLIDILVLSSIPVDGEVIEIEENDEEEDRSPGGGQSPGQGAGVDKGVEQPLRAQVYRAHGHVGGQGAGESHGWEVG